MVCTAQECEMKKINIRFSWLPDKLPAAELALWMQLPPSAFGLKSIFLFTSQTRTKRTADNWQLAAAIRGRCNCRAFSIDSLAVASAPGDNYFSLSRVARAQVATRARSGFLSVNLAGSKSHWMCIKFSVCGQLPINSMPVGGRCSVSCCSGFRHCFCCAV